ncbi:MAG: hypothetical protein HQ448_07270, partial [Cytophagales bacterium]|nr:hypothetical protein [Cytophagales bacterium]
MAYLIYFIIGEDLSDTNKVAYDFNDEKIVNSAIDSISHIEHVIDTMSTILPVYTTQVEDFEAKADVNKDFIHFQIFKSHQLIFEKKIKNFKIKNLISSDLNNNQQPEFWIFGDDNAHKFQIFGYEFNKNSFNLIKFPNLKGRQEFGYSGKDSLYFVKSDIVRSFQFKNDQYSDLVNG